MAFYIIEISGKWFRLIVTGDLIPQTEGIKWSNRDNKWSGVRKGSCVGA